VHSKLLLVNKFVRRLTSVSDEGVFTEDDVAGWRAESGSDASDDSSGHQDHEVGGKEEHGPANGLKSMLEIIYFHKIVHKNYYNVDGPENSQSLRQKILKSVKNCARLYINPKRQFHI
jgi:hypothetical protein